jgi:hypothetical protein
VDSDYLALFCNRPVSGPGSTETDSGWIRHGPSRVREGKNGNLNLVVSARTSLGLPRIIIKEVKPKETMSRPSPARNHFKLGLQGTPRDLIDATTWKEFNGIAAAHGVWLDLRANGFVFTHRRSLVRVKASSISRHLAKPALEARQKRAVITFCNKQVCCDN